MNARSITGIASAMVAVLFAAGVSAQTSPVDKDRLYNPPYGYGSVALLSDRVGNVSETRKLLLLPQYSSVEFARRPLCKGYIAHYDAQRSGKDTFFGIQTVKIFNRFQPAVFVWRNSGWRSQDGGELPGMNGAEEVAVTSAKDFALAHTSQKSLEELRLVSGKPVVSHWHARLPATPGSQDIVYTADERWRRFWTGDPQADGIFADTFKRYLSEGALLRVENSLIRLKITDSKNVDEAVPFTFECNNALLLAAAIRLYDPLSTDPPVWYFIEFKK